ncbi:MAG TPA: CoB--CoM heterodisulfide reductase iron-sulfur subunit B family protein [Syntrophorhabdaceae bacterium]|nr:CoB--CoM heterodisulfide reductase iron-sulfur subunit B family protein [Syntrophorhabdaceae bacterium]
MITLTYFPGCSMETSSKIYDASLRQVFSHYGIGLKELEDWSCCGSSAAHTIDEKLAHVLSARNLALAEKDGNHFFAPCSSCYNRTLITNDRIRKDPGLRDAINSVIAPLSCRGTVEVKNIIEVLRDHVGLERIAKSVSYDLSGLKLVPYYGCVLTRIPGTPVFDDVENPTSMDDLLWVTGSELVNWPYKTECCGASKTLTNKDVTARLSGKIMDMANSVGADAIVTPCPLCQMNLDLLPYLGRSGKNMPVLFLTEIYELALFGKMSGSSSHMISVEGLKEKVKPLSAKRMEQNA